MFIFLSFMVAASLITKKYNIKCTTIIWIRTWTLYLNIYSVCNIYCLVSSLWFTRFRLVLATVCETRHSKISYYNTLLNSKRATFLGVDFLFSILNRPTAIFAPRNVAFLIGGERGDWIINPTSGEFFNLIFV